MKRSKYLVLEEIDIPDEVMRSWQETVDLVAELLEMPSALIMRVHLENIEVLVASRNDENVYHHGDLASLDTGLYCETVMSTREPLLVPNALADPEWKNNPDVELNMISYYGLPLTWPGGETFGTICVLDNKENKFRGRAQELLKRFQQSVLYGLENIYQRCYYANEAARVSDELGIMLKAIQQSPSATAVADKELKLIYQNRCYERLCDVLNENDRKADDRVDFCGLEIDQATKTVILASLSKDAQWEGEIEFRHQDDQRWERVRVSQVLDAAGSVSHYLITGEDITPIKAHEAKLERLALFDPLTGLPNRSLLLDRLDSYLEESRRVNTKVAVLFIDLDDFKRINDAMGHESGDELIVTIAKKLQRTVRSSDTLARFGGDEFIVLMRNIQSLDAVNRLIALIDDVFKEHCEIGNTKVRTSGSIGVAIYPDDGDNPSLLLRHADLAMYHSKERGLGKHTFYLHSMNSVTERQVALNDQLHLALVNNELDVYYQPQIWIESGKIRGFEALLRWNNVVLGAVAPNEFIPIAERSDLILSLGQFVLEKALAQLAVWQKTHQAELTMAVNFSPSQFQDESLNATIHCLLGECGLSGDALEVEITEGLLLSKRAHVMDSMNVLREHGITIAIDDFGKGYSSLSYVSRYPFNVIKIDRGFIKNMIHDLRNRHLVKSVIYMAHGVGCKVIAEGVETREQLDILRQFDCDIAQGYFFSRPLPANDMPFADIQHLPC